MKVTVLTAFPEFLDSFLTTSIVGRAVERGLIDVKAVNLRDFSEGNYHQIDDYSFGGKGGMTIMPQVLERALASVRTNPEAKVLFPTPTGAVLTQDLVESLAQEKELIVICGHYEGVDQRVIDKIVDEEISIGDYVLTGGELPAMVLTDCVARMCPGVLSDDVCFEEESIYSGLLEYPHYTRPEVWEGESVPPVLMSGHHANIEKWRREQSLELTKQRRPDLYEEYMKKEN